MPRASGAWAPVSPVSRFSANPGTVATSAAFTPDPYDQLVTAIQWFGTANLTATPSDSTGLNWAVVGANGSTTSRLWVAIARAPAVPQSMTVSWTLSATDIGATCRVFRIPGAALAVTPFTITGTSGSLTLGLNAVPPADSSMLLLIAGKSYTGADDPFAVPGGYTQLTADAQLTSNGTTRQNMLAAYRRAPSTPLVDVNTTAGEQVQAALLQMQLLPRSEAVAHYGAAVGSAW